MWQLRKKALRLTERLHFGELNQLNGCGRAEREAGCVRRAEELSGKRPQFLLPRLNLFSFFLLYWWSSDPSLPLSPFSKSIFSLKCSALSLSSPLFLPYTSFFFILVKSLSALLLPLWLLSLFSQSLYSTQADTQPVGARWDETKLDWRSHGVNAQELYSLLEPIRIALTYIYLILFILNHTGSGSSLEQIPAASSLRAGGVKH